MFSMFVESYPVHYTSDFIFSHNTEDQPSTCCFTIFTRTVHLSEQDHDVAFVLFKLCLIFTHVDKVMDINFEKLMVVWGRRCIFYMGKNIDVCIFLDAFEARNFETAPDDEIVKLYSHTGLMTEVFSRSQQN